MSQKSKHPIVDLIRVILATLNQKWILKSILFSIPTLVPLIWATPLNSVFFNDKGINKFGVVTIICCVVIVPIQFLASYVANNDISDVESYDCEVHIRKKVTEAENRFEKNKNDLLSSSFKSIAYEKGQLFDFVRHHINPSARTSQILTQISDCFADVCEMDSNEIVLSALVSCDNKDWDWLCNPNLEGCADKKTLLSSSSSLKKVIDEEVYYYNNSKEKAIKNNEYIADNRDKNENNMGSIICWEVATTIKPPEESDTDCHRLRMIISISTYGRKLLIDEDNQEAIDKTYKEVFKNMILKSFKGELCENLLWWGFIKLSDKSH